MGSYQQPSSSEAVAVSVWVDSENRYQLTNVRVISISCAACMSLGINEHLLNGAHSVHENIIR